MENRRLNTRRERRNPLEHPVGILMAELGDLIFPVGIWASFLAIFSVISLEAVPEGVQIMAP